MSGRKHKSKLKKVVYTLLSFVLAVLLTVLAAASALQFTLLSESFLINNIESTNYVREKKAEIATSLTDLGYATGLEEEFFEDLLDEVMIHDDMTEYIHNYYTGEGSVVDKTAFIQTFNTALDEYIKKKNIDPNTVSADSRNYLIDRAANIYKESLEIPFFNKFAGKFQNLKTIVPFVIIVCLLLSALLCAIFVLSTRWKHRAAKYICYATSTAFLTTAVMPLILFLSRKAETFNSASRATYKLFVSCANNMLICILACSVFFLLVSIALYIAYRKLYNEVTD